MTPYREKRCHECGGKIERRGVDLGYTSAKELNRPAGAKGRDEYAIIDACANCGNTLWAWLPAPCYICGKTGTKGILLIDFAELVTGIGDWVPGMPNTVNLCDNPRCWEILENDVNHRMDQAIKNGAFE